MGTRTLPAAPSLTRECGFTLVELLVALLALAILAGLSWRGLDAMVRAQSQLRARADQLLALQVGLAQWTADLDALERLPQFIPIDWNGRVLRLVRRSGAQGPHGSDGVVVAAWTQHSIDGRDTWIRWQSPPVVRRLQLEQAWLRAEAWARDPADTGRFGQVPVLPIAQWTLLYFRDNTWGEPGASPSPVPEGIRLVLTLPPDGPTAGTLTLDWVSPRTRVRPTGTPS